MRLTTNPTVRALRFVAGVAGLLLLAACDGPNAFATPIPGSGGTGPGGDTKAPVVDIQSPRGDSLSAKPLGDSVLVRVRVTDNVGVDSLVFLGIAERGDKLLGTDTIIPRFLTKSVKLRTGLKDTTITRYLIPIPSTVKELSKIIVVAVDGEGNITADTSKLVLGGPDIHLENVTEGQSIQAGLGLTVRITAQDPQGIIQLRLDFAGAFTKSVVKTVNPPNDSIVFDTTVVVPAGVSGALTVTAVARNALDVAGQDGPFHLNVVSATAGDTIRPSLRAIASSADRLELKDSIAVVVTGQDNTQGSGVKTAGFTVLGIAPSRGDTIIRSGTRTFAPPRTGTVNETFKFPTFNVDSLSLPDTLVYEVTGYLVDAQGNCAASIGGPDVVSLPCDTLPTGQIVAHGRTGQRLTRTIVSGRTVVLPNGGTIMDAVLDSTRRNLYLSNLSQDRVEVFRIQQEKFLNAIAVGSEPWGLSLNFARDTLLIGNSGGTNVSSVYLGSAAGVGPFTEASNRRLLTPRVPLFTLETVLDAGGFIRYNLTILPGRICPSFADRPQFMAVDSTREIIYSTKTTSIACVGTVRRAFVPNAAGAKTEVRLIFASNEVIVPNPSFISIANVDSVYVIRRNTSSDSVGVFSHPLGFPDQPVGFVTASPSVSVDSIAALGSPYPFDVLAGAGTLNIRAMGFADTTFVSASGDGGHVVIGEGSVSPVGRIMMWDAQRKRVSDAIEVTDLFRNAAETVKGIGLNYDGTLGVARGFQAYFFTTDLRLQGVGDLPFGGAGAVMHPLHANAKSLDNPNGEYRPDTHMAFAGTGEHTIDILDTFHFYRQGRLFIRDIIQGPLRAVLPFPEDNAGLTCATIPVTDQAGKAIGNAIQIFENGDFERPIAPDGITDDRCIVVKLFGVTDTGGVVVVDVRKADILRDHPARHP